MGVYKNALMRYLDSEGIKYRDVSDREVTVTYNCDNISSVCVHVIFDKDDSGTVAFRSWDFGKVKESQFAAMLNVCNECNKKFRWVKFCIDGDSDISAEIDAVTDIGTVGSECLQLVRRMVSICDDAYPEFMKAKWA